MRKGRSVVGTSIALGAAWSLGCAGVSSPPLPDPIVVPVALVTPAPVLVAEPSDPASISGPWTYRTRGSCNKGIGTGEVSFRWRQDLDVYEARGVVRWSDLTEPIRWQGRSRYDPRSNTLSERVGNTLGDAVESTWRIESADRLVLGWRQTNGCRGIGIATRGHERAVDPIELCDGCGSDEFGCIRSGGGDKPVICDPWCCQQRD